MPPDTPRGPSHRLTANTITSLHLRTRLPRLSRNGASALSIASLSPGLACTQISHSHQCTETLLFSGWHPSYGADPDKRLHPCRQWPSSMPVSGQPVLLLGHQHLHLHSQHWTFTVRREVLSSTHPHCGAGGRGGQELLLLSVATMAPPIPMCSHHTSPLGFRLLGIESGHQDTASILEREVRLFILWGLEGGAAQPVWKSNISQGIVTSPSTPQFSLKASISCPSTPH